MFGVDKETDHVLEELAEQPDISKEAHYEAVKWAQETNDGLLRVQIQTGMLARAFIQSLVVAERCFRQFLRVEAGQSPQPMSQRSIRYEQVSII